MKKIIDYYIVIAESERELQELVKENINDWGWQPIGGVSVTHWKAEDERHWSFCQAMVKYEN